MIKKYSKNKVLLGFFTIVLISFVFFIFYLGHKKQENRIYTIKKYEKISEYIKKNLSSEQEIIEYLKVIALKKPLNIREIIAKGKILYHNKSFTIYEMENIFYLCLDLNKNKKLIFKDISRNKSLRIVYAMFFIAFLFLILSYLWLNNSLYLLDKIKVDITKVANENLYFDSDEYNRIDKCESELKLSKILENIEFLLQSRKLFLRTVVHELNTPVAKGRIVCELIDNKIQKNRMIKIFQRLEFLINHFLNFEKVLSKTYNVDKKSYEIKIIIKDALETLMIKDVKSKVLIDIELNKKINVDLVLMSTVFKNFIDNAIKYSIGKSIKIKSYKENILFISKGEKISKNIQKYYEPFHNNSENNNGGKGLGLYIIKTILDIHEYSLEYKYINGFNVFVINLDKKA